MHLSRLRKPAEFGHIKSDLAAYFDIYEKATGRGLDSARVLELGYGQRPFRIIALQSLGISAAGIDLDAPLYRLDVRTLARIAQRNGFTRALKSSLRRAVFDGHEYRGLAAFLQENYGRPMSLDVASLIVGDASETETWARASGPFDFVYSEDVLEHVPLGAIRRVLENLANNLVEDGVAVVTPMIFTGICGGHDLGWYPHQVNTENVARGPAWGHLTGESPVADTFLNRLTRAQFRGLFEERFVIESETALLCDVGRQHLTPERRRVLSDFPEEELFSNSVRFVLRKKRKHPYE